MLGQHVEVDAGRDRRVGLPGAQALAGEVHGHQGRGLGGVDSEARTAQVEEVREPVGDDPAVQAGHGVLGDRLGALSVEQVGVVVALRADEHSRAGAAQGVRHDAGILQCFPGQFENQALLRVHHGCLARRDAEELGVEVLHLVEEPTMSGHPFVVRRGEAFGWGHGDGVAAFAEQPPELLRSRCARQPTCQADDRDGAFPHIPNHGVPSDVATDENGSWRRREWSAALGFGRRFP